MWFARFQILICEPQSIWCKLLVLSQLYLILGCGSGNDLDCIAKDFALLGSCNHTITTHGTYGHWAAYFAGGEIYTEYGSIIPGTL